MLLSKTVGKTSSNRPISIQQKEQPAADDIAYVSRKFRALIDQQSGLFPSKNLHLFAYADDGQIG